MKEHRTLGLCKRELYFCDVFSLKTGIKCEKFNNFVPTLENAIFSHFFQCSLKETHSLHSSILQYLPNRICCLIDLNNGRIKGGLMMKTCHTIERSVDDEFVCKWTVLTIHISIRSSTFSFVYLIPCILKISLSQGGQPDIELKARNLKLIMGHV